MAEVTSAAQPVQHRPAVPDADPVAIRGCLTPDVAAVFDAEWERALDAAKQPKDLVGVHQMLRHWRHFAYQELLEPGSYFRVLAVAARTLATRRAPEGSRSIEEIRALVDARLAEAERQ